MFGIPYFVLNLLKEPERNTSGILFYITGRYVFAVSLCLSIIVVKTPFFGEKISCRAVLKMSEKQTTAFCFSKDFYTLLPNNVSVRSFISDGGQLQEAKRYHKYYGFIAPLLVFQAVCFGVPMLFWERNEKMLISKILDLFNSADKDELQILRAKSYIVSYFYDNTYFKVLPHSKMNVHSRYITTYVVLEVIQGFNTIVQFGILYYLFGDFFIQSGQNILKGTVQLSRFSFPTEVLCPLSVIGPSGDMQQMDTLCCLQHNLYYNIIFHVEFYLFGLFVILFLLTFFYRMITLFTHKGREFLLTSWNSVADSKDVHYLKFYAGMGDIWVLHILREYIDCHVYKQIVKEVNEFIEQKID